MPGVPVRLILLFLVPVYFLACRSEPGSPGGTAGVQAGAPVYDWTGTYEFTDAGAGHTYQLKLHKRSVDGSYELQYLSNEKGDMDPHSEYMFDARDKDSSMYIRFMGSFSAPETDWPFRKGDTMFILTRYADASVATAWKALSPKDAAGNFKQVSLDYH